MVLNGPLARQLGVGAGDDVMLRLPRQGAIPAESPLGRKTETVAAERVRVQAVIPAAGPGRFDLRPNQQPPRTAFVSLDWLQDRLKQPQRANAIFVASRDPERAAPPEAEASLAGLLRPTLADFGIRVEKTDRGYFNITSDRMILSPAAETAIEESLRGLSFQPALVYLAKTIECRGAKVPYSTIAAVDFTAAPPLGPLLAADGKAIGPLAPEEIVLELLGGRRPPRPAGRHRRGQLFPAREPRRAGPPGRPAGPLPSEGHRPPGRRGRRPGLYAGRARGDRSTLDQRLVAAGTCAAVSFRREFGSRQR